MIATVSARLVLACAHFVFWFATLSVAAILCVTLSAKVGVETIVDEAATKAATVSSAIKLLPASWLSRGATSTSADS
ncbi:MAG: hypothetical protein ABIQ30_04415 [Devosia sp.]